MKYHDKYIVIVKLEALKSLDIAKMWRSLKRNKMRRLDFIVNHDIKYNWMRNWRTQNG
jgi:hypothetical protein